MAGETHTPNAWEKIRTITGLVATVAIPLVIAVVGNEYATALKHRETQQRFVELAIDILKQKPEDANAAIRRWAVQVVDQYSGVPLESETAAALVKGRGLGLSRPDLAAEVTAADETNNVFVISKGSGDGVRVGDRFVVSRDIDYIGVLQINVVQPQISAGSAVLDLKRSEIRVKDHAFFSSEEMERPEIPNGR